ncbi:MAG: DNA invertase Pin-like site-specific DNA recombinase [Cocleimonas sp.]|jgi:DNA invertase Pin-like site-specific DNA recombinase
MKIGYSRVSTIEQSLDSQTDALKNAGCERIYTEKASGKTKVRPELERMLDAMREGDIVVVWRLDRLGRSLTDLIDLMGQFKDRGVEFISLTEQIDTTTPIGTLTFHLFASIAEFERQLTSERTKVGLQAARARGRKGGRKVKLTKGEIKKAQAMLLDSSVTKTDVATHFGISRPTLNKYLTSTGEADQPSLL